MALVRKRNFDSWMKGLSIMEFASLQGKWVKWYDYDPKPPKDCMFDDEDEALNARPGNRSGQFLIARVSYEAESISAFLLTRFSMSAINKATLTAAAAIQSK